MADTAGNNDFYGTGMNNVGNANNQGQGFINSFDPNATINQQKSDSSGFFGGQQNAQNDYIKQYQGAVNSQPSLASTYSRLNDQYGVPTLAANANYLNNQVLQTPQQQLNLAKGFNYDQNQVNNATNQQMERLQPLASSATNQLQTAEGLVNQGVGYQQAQNNFMVQPIQAEQPLLQNMQTNQASNWSQQQQDQLNGLIAKMQSGVQLSTADMNAFVTLSGQEEAYQQAKNANATALAQQRLINQYQNVNQNSNLYNTQTGALINPTIANPTGMRVIQ